MNTEKIKAFVLKATKFSEADLIITALSQSGCKISLLAKSALKSKKRFSGGVFQPTHYIEMQIKKRSQPDRLPFIQEANLIKDFIGLRKNYDRLETALFVIDCLLKTAQEGTSPDSSLFNICGHSLAILEKLESIDLSLFQIHFIIRLLHDQGVLNRESWMEPFLCTSISSHAQFSASPQSLSLAKVAQEFQNQMKFQMSHYLSQGAT